ncbi:MAG: IspD/TarI family cytidylyltransferase [Bacilli bacterium]
MFDVIILMAGTGQRAKLEYNKVFYQLMGKEVYQYSVDVFMSHEKCRNIILVVNENDLDRLESFGTNVIITKGGRTRMESVYCGLKHVQSEYVFIHDAARPNINSFLIDKLYQDVFAYDAAALAVKSTNAIKTVQDFRIEKTLNRSNLIEMQTPQAIKTSIYKEALQKAIDDGVNAYDDMEVVLLYTTVKPVYTNSSYSNIKITNEIDFKIMEVIMKEKI